MWVHVGALTIVVECQDSFVRFQGSWLVLSGAKNGVFQPFPPFCRYHFVEKNIEKPLRSAGV